MTYYMPTKLFMGPGAVSLNAKALKTLGERCFIVASPNAARLSGALDDAENALKANGIAYGAFCGMTQNPRLSDAMRAGLLAHDFGAGFILGIGGGSPMDAAKAVSVFASNPGLTEEGFYAKSWPNDPLPIALIGTDAGTGSEVTMVSVMTDSGGRKHSIHDERLYAKFAFGDAKYLSSMPREAALSCCIDIIAHCAESWFSVKAGALSRSFAVYGIRQAISPLEKMLAGEALGEGEMCALYEASILGGMAINLTGTCFPHNVGYYLTERFNVPHGIACAAFLEELLEFETDISESFYAETGVSASSLEGQRLGKEYHRRRDLEDIRRAL